MRRSSLMRRGRRRRTPYSRAYVCDASPSPAAWRHRLRSIPPTIFSEMSALAVRTGSLNLGQGFPDQDGPPGAVEAAVEALRAGRNQYPPGPGVPELREAVAAHQPRHYGIELDPASEVVVTAGATEAIAAAIFALVEPGRRDGGARAVLRLLRRVHRDGRRRTASGDAARAGLPARRRRAAGRGHRRGPRRSC